MASKRVILKKIKNLITKSFKTQEEAFAFFDKNADQSLDKKELKKLVREAEVSKWLSGVVASKMVTELDGDGDKSLNWSEFRKSMKKLVAEV